MLTSMWRRSINTIAVAAALLVAVVESAQGVDARERNSVALTSDEKAMLRDLVKLMWKMQWEDGPFETLTDCLNPPTQMGDQTCYTKTINHGLDGMSGFEAETRIEQAIKQYLSMINNNKLCKDTKLPAGAWTYPAPGLGNDSVGISAALLDIWKDPTKPPVDRAYAKFYIMASLANELAHVYQKKIPPPVLPDPSDPAYPAAAAAAAALKLRIGCDRERDSDIMSIKFLNMLLDRLKGATGAHGSLGDIEAEGFAGKCVAKCLMNLGVTTGPQIQSLVDQLRARLAIYEDRLANLFNNQIDQARSWRALYGTGLYKTPLHLKVDASMLFTMRQFKVMYGNSMAVLSVPVDGKGVAGYIVTVNKESQIVVIVITVGINGSVCIHTWTDTDFDGVPQAYLTGVVMPGLPYAGDQPPQQNDAYFIHRPVELPGFNDPLYFHDMRNGTLTVFDLNNAGAATGSYRHVLRSPLIADPASGNPLGGGFYSLHGIQGIGAPPPAVPSQIRFTFRHELSVDDSTDVPAVVGVYDTFNSTSTFELPPTLALAAAPGNPIGLSEIPPLMDGLLLMSDPGDTVVLESIGNGPAQPVVFAPIPNTGMFLVGNPQLQAGPDLYRLFSNFDSSQMRYAKARSGSLADVFDHPVTGGPNPDVLVLSDYPGRISVFSGDPAPAFQLVSEIVTEDPNPGLFDLPVPTGSLQLVSTTREVALTPIAFSPLIAQTLVDLDGDGFADDAAVIARLNPGTSTQVYTVINASNPVPSWFPSVTVPFVPAGYSYQNFNNDGRSDLKIENALGGPALCLVSTGVGGFLPSACTVACPADFNHSGQVTVQDLFDFLTAYFMFLPSADFNQSGFITVQDIFDYLAAYFTGCP